MRTISVISPKIWPCIHPFFHKYAPVSTPYSYCIGYRAILHFDYRTIVLPKLHIVQCCDWMVMVVVVVMRMMMWKIMLTIIVIMMWIITIHAEYPAVDDGHGGGVGGGGEALEQQDHLVGAGFR